MRTTLRLTAVAMAVALVSPVQAAPMQAAPLFTPEDVFQLRYASHPLVDGEGEQALYLRHSMDIMQDKSRANLWLVDLDTGAERPITTGTNNISSPALSPDDSRVAYVDRDDAGQQLFVSWLDTARTAQLTRLPQKPEKLAWSPDGEWLAFSMLVHQDPPTMGQLPRKPEGATWAPPAQVINRTVYRSDGKGDRPTGFTHVFVIPAEGGSPRQVTRGDFHHDGDIAWSADGESLFVSANRNPDWEMNIMNTDIYRVSLGDGEITALTDRQGPDGSQAVSPDGELIAYLGWDDRRMSYHRNRLYLMRSDGSQRRELLADLDRSISAVQWADDGRRLFVQYDDQGATVLAATTLAGDVQVMARDLGGKSLGRPYTSADFAVGGDAVYAYTASTPLSPAELAVGEDGDNRRVTQLNDNLLQHRELAQVEELWLESAHDGRKIQAWVARPPGFSADRQYPLILEIHGGPHTAYGPHFAAEVQLYAAAGYVVVYVNPRGSTSYGEAFANLIHHNYPSEDYDDLMSAVDAVIERGYVDPEQLYITGGSGGGVLTAWTVGSTDRFRAAVVAKPVINWASFVLTADNAPYFSQYWFEKMPWEAPMAYWQRSPLALVGKVTTPTMLLTGEADLRTPMAETEQYYQALKLRGVDTAMVRMPGASHGIYKRPSQLLGKVAAILAWFERYAPAEA